MHLLTVDLNLAVALHALLEERSVTRAARRVGLSQSAMSHTLSRLRAHFDDELLLRSGREMIATPRALALQEPVRRLVQQAEQVFRPPKQFDPLTLRRTFRIEMPDAVTSVLLSAMDRRLSAIAPHASMAVLSAQPGSDGLRQNRVDAVIGTLAPDSGLPSEPLYQDQLVCICARRNPLADQPLTLERFVEAPHLSVSNSAVKADSALDHQLVLYGLRRRVTHTLPSHLSLAHLVSRTLSIAVVPGRMARALANSHGLAILTPPVALETIQVSFWWHQRNHQDPEHQVLREVIMGAARDMPANP